MGFILTQKVIRASVGLSTTEKLTLISVADRIDTKGYSFPSIGLLAREVGVGKRTIYRAIDRLERDGFLEIRRITGQSNRYSVLESALKSTKGGDTHDTPTPDTGDTPPLTPKTLGSVTDVTLIDKAINKGIDKGNRTGEPPLHHLYLKGSGTVEAKGLLKNKNTGIMGELFIGLETSKAEVENKIAGMKIVINNQIPEGQIVMKTLDAIKSAVDGTGLKQKKKMEPRTLWKKAVAAWMVEQDISCGMVNVTNVDAGKLNVVAKKVGHRFPQVLKKCVENWDAFTMYTSKAVGYDCYPEQPSIGFFVKNIGTAVTFDPSTKYTSDIKCNNEDILD